MSEIEVLEAKQHFPRVGIFEDRGRTGEPVIRLSIKNPEFVRGGGKGLVRGVLGFVVIIGLFPALILAAILTEQAFPEWGWVIGVGAVFVGFAFFWDWMHQPALYHVVIEIDKPGDRLRVFRDGRLTAERNLSLLQNLTVEPHPEAESIRAERLAKGEKKLSQAERTHCLFGWFGYGGADKVLLVSRAEWPNRNSLFEVRQAILWAIERVAGPKPRDKTSERPQPAAVGGGLNPPLD